MRGGNGRFELGIFDHSGVLSDDRLPVYETNMELMEIYGLGGRMEKYQYLMAIHGTFLHLPLTFHIHQEQ